MQMEKFVRQQVAFLRKSLQVSIGISAKITVNDKNEFANSLLKQIGELR